MKLRRKHYFWSWLVDIYWGPSADGYRLYIVVGPGDNKKTWLERGIGRKHP